jgi:mono/diheme cytochrome c family protein
VHPSLRPSTARVVERYPRSDRPGGVRREHFTAVRYAAMSKPSWVVVVLASVLLTTAACSDESGSGDGDVAAGRESAGARGSEVYVRQCAACHGAELQGSDGGPSLLSIVYEPGHHPDRAFRSAIVNGSPQHHWAFGPMPPIEGLTEQDVDAVIAFIRTEQQRRGFQR